MNAKIEQVGDGFTFTVTTTATIRPKADEVAAMFAAFDAHAQAGALVRIALIADGWPSNGAEKQWLAVGHALRKYGPPAAEMLRSILAFYDESAP